jgi:hypothetical protein
MWVVIGYHFDFFRALIGSYILLLSDFCSLYPKTFIGVGRFDFLRYIIEHVKIASPHNIFMDNKSDYQLNGVCVKIL